MMLRVCTTSRRWPATRGAILNFYTRVPGMRLVKRTVNFDDPAGYHFYFGAGAGAPGTLLTFFPWVTGRQAECKARGRFRRERCAYRRSPPEPIADPDGIGVEFIESADSPGLQSVTLCEADAGPTVAFLRDVLGLELPRRNGIGRAWKCRREAWIDVLHSPGTSRGKMAAGMVHHVGAAGGG